MRTSKYKLDPLVALAVLLVLGLGCFAWNRARQADEVREATELHEIHMAHYRSVDECIGHLHTPKACAYMLHERPQ